MVLSPDAYGDIITIKGLDTKITLSAVGGPITLDLYSSSSNTPAGGQVFSFVKNIIYK